MRKDCDELECEQCGICYQKLNKENPNHNITVLVDRTEKMDELGAIGELHNAITTKQVKQITFIFQSKKKARKQF